MNKYLIHTSKRDHVGLVYFATSALEAKKAAEHEGHKVHHVVFVKDIDEEDEDFGQADHSHLYT